MEAVTPEFYNKLTSQLASKGDKFLACVEQKNMGEYRPMLFR
jgi:hypothetical protein